MNRKKHIIKKVMKSGNAGSVYVPKDWIDQLVVIRLFSVNAMILEALSPHIENILGIYLHGPHARGEGSPESDIDVFIITDKEIPLKKTGGMNIEAVNMDEVEEYVRDNPVEFHHMIREAVPVMNETLLEELRSYELNQEMIEGYYRDVEKTLSLARELELDKDHSGAIYSLILRLKGMYSIQLGEEEYSREGLEDYIVDKGLSREKFRKLYEVYEARKEEKQPQYETTLRDVRKLHRIAEDMLEEGKT